MKAAWALDQIFEPVKVYLWLNKVVRICPEPHQNIAYILYMF